jgi:hypothetical protein
MNRIHRMEMHTWVPLAQPVHATSAEEHSPRRVVHSVMGSITHSPTQQGSGTTRTCNNSSPRTHSLLPATRKMQALPGRTICSCAPL